MDFADAFRMLLQGKRMTRTDGEYIYITNGKSFDTNDWIGDDVLTRQELNAGFVCTSSHIDRKKRNGSREIGWTPTTDDMFADDWRTVE